MYPVPAAGYGVPMSFTVVFKEEDFHPDGTPFGPIIVIDEEKRAADPKAQGIGIPYGYQPAWRIERPWGTLDEAKALAAELGAQLTAS